MYFCPNLLNIRSLFFLTKTNFSTPAFSSGILLIRIANACELWNSCRNRHILCFFFQVRLPELIGLSRALDLILTGRIIEAREAQQMGIANRVVNASTAYGQVREDK